MMPTKMPPELDRELKREKIRVIAFMGTKRHGEAPFFLAALWPAEPDEYGAILDPDKFYATAEGDSPEEAVRLFRDKLYGGL